MSQIETLIRPDKAVQWAFGRWQCASSSEIQKLLDGCTLETVSALRNANRAVYQQHGVAAQHNFSQDMLLLDVDMTGLLASKHAEGSTKGYFANNRGKRGRQLCRVLATPYQEILCQMLLPGVTLSKATLQPALQDVQQLLQLSPTSRHHTLLRWDAGFGTDRNINWMLHHGYHILGKMYSHTRVKKLCHSISEWVPSLSSPGREYGVIMSPHRYARKTMQLMVRTPKKAPKTGWEYGALVTTLLHLTPQEVIDLYDDRGGGVEIDFRSDRQGLGLSTRRKHRMAAQQMLIHLAERAHNVLIWTARQFASPLHQYGIVRLVRDVLPISGYLLIRQEQPVEIGLNRHHPLASTLYNSFNRLFTGSPLMKLWDPVDDVKEPQRG